MAETPVNSAPARKEFNLQIDLLLPGDLLHENETVIFALKPSPWAIVFLSIRVILIAILVMLLVLVLRGWLGGQGGRIIQAAAFVALARVGFAILQWLSRVYVLTDKRIIRIRGVFTIDIFQCSLSRLQNTFLSMSFAQRLLSLGNIAFTTAGQGQVEAIWRHIKRPMEVHKQLLRAINTAGNQGL